MDQVRLPDLEVIKRFSIAVRREHAAVEDVIEALETDLAAIKRATSVRPRPATSFEGVERIEPKPARRAPARATPARSKRKPVKPAKKKQARGRR